MPVLPQVHRDRTVVQLFAAIRVFLRLPGPNTVITAVGLAATRLATCSPDASVSATSGRVAVGRAEREVHRWVHPHVSRQYQRTSAQALPPSATIRPTGEWMPHIQHDLTWADSPPNGAGCCRSGMTCSPRSPPARAVISARDVGLPTVVVRSSSRSSSGSPTLMRTLPLHIGERGAATGIPSPRSGGTVPIYHRPNLRSQIG
jgi:hypothetical protein